MNKSGKKSTTQPEDRRVQRTRKLLSDALVSLILEKGYDQVSIQDIIDRANVGRSTFYLHYENKEQLLLWGHEHLKKLIVQEGDREINFLDFYHHLVERRQLARAVLAQESGQVVTQYLNDVISQNILRLHAPAEGAAREERTLVALRAAAAAAAVVRFMTAWLTADMPCSAETMANESARAIRRILGHDS
jgi:AcrR family transcriptional regulator